MSSPEGARVDAHTSAPDAELVQLLTPQGVRVEDPTYSPLVAHLTADDLRGFYRDMVVVRAFDNEATSLQRQGELALWVQCLGQEAAQIGSGRALAPQDYTFPAYRELRVAPSDSCVLPETGLTLHSGDMVYTMGIWGERPDAVENVRPPGPQSVPALRRKFRKPRT